MHRNLDERVKERIETHRDCVRKILYSTRRRRRGIFRGEKIPRIFGKHVRGLKGEALTVYVWMMKLEEVWGGKRSAVDVKMNGAVKDEGYAKG